MDINGNIKLLERWKSGRKNLSRGRKSVEKVKQKYGRNY